MSAPQRVPELKPYPRVHYQYVTPEQASIWLANQHPNRRLKPRKIRGFARDMKAGSWMLNGEFIRFDTDARLIDGQNRLHAIIAADIPVECGICTGIQLAARLTIDTGTARTFSDALEIDGNINTNATAAALSWIHKYENGTMLDSGTGSHSELLQIAERHPALANSIALAVSGPRPASVATIAFVHYMASRISPDLAGEFVNILQHGVTTGGLSVTAENPAYRLRERLMMQRASGKARLPRTEVMALMIRAWNLFRVGKAIKVLRWRSSGPAAEPFPTFEDR